MIDDDRREGQRRGSDQWRGQISEQVRAHERKFVEHNGSLKDLRAEVQGLRDDVIGLKGQVIEARSDIGEAVASIGKSRDEETTGLRAEIRDAKVSTRDLLITVALPILVLLVAALVLGHGHL